MVYIKCLNYEYTFFILLSFLFFYFDYPIIIIIIIIYIFILYPEPVTDGCNCVDSYHLKLLLNTFDQKG